MPKLGITMDEGTVADWRVQPGDAVAEGDVILTVETDKAMVDVPATAPGVLLAILVPAGGTAAVGTPIARFAAAGEAAAATPPPGTPAADHPPEVAAALARRRASPLARRLAAEHGLDLMALAGSGPRGRIIRQDVEAALVGTEAAISAGASAATPAAVAGRREPLSRMRRAIAERMTASAQSIPTFRVTMPADVTASEALRLALAGTGIRLTLSDLLIQAVALALSEHPLVNAGFVPGSGGAEAAVEYHDSVNLGWAVAVPHGLLVPVLAHAQALPLPEISRQRADLVEAARTGHLRPEQLSGGTFTISNLGPYGVEQFDALINPPEAAILAVGAAVPRPAVVEGRVEARTSLYLTLICDHRLLDGATAAQFLGAVVQRLEKAEGYRLL